MQRVKTPSPRTGTFVTLRASLRGPGTGAPSARRLALLALSLAALLALSAAPASASAAVTHPFLSSFDGTDTPAGSFGQADGVAVDATSGDAYVADTANDVVDKFDSTGTYLCQITGAGSATSSASECDESAAGPPAALSFAGKAIALAVDNSAGPNAGDIYVVDAGNGVIDRFDSSGKYLSQITGPFSGTLLGIGVDASGNLWADDEGGKVYEFGPAGNEVFDFSTGGPRAPFAVDSNDNTYLSNASGIERFDSTGHNLGLVEYCGFCAEAIAIDLSTDDLYVYNANVAEPYVVEYDPTGHQLLQFGQAQLTSGTGGENGRASGIAVNPLTGTIYVANANDAKVYIFGPNPGPRVTPQAASEVKATELTANATVNPEGAQLSECSFEYGTDTSYGQSKPCAQSLASIGSGNTPVAVSAQLPGLKPGTTYHFRLATANANGAVAGADRHAATLPAPVIDEAKAIEVEPTSATLTAKINPQGNASHYHFEYDTVAYQEGGAPHGTAVPIPDEAIGNATADVEVSQHLEELTPGTTYHWRVVAENVNGQAPDVDHTFVFLPPPPHETCPENEALRTGPSAALPDCRAYEQVTPPAKNGSLVGDIFIFGAVPDVSTAGSRLMAPAIQCFAGAGSCNAVRSAIGSPYSFTRSAAGWQASALSPPASQFAGSTPLRSDPDAGTALFSAPSPTTGEDRWIARQPDGSFLDIGPVTPPPAGAQGPRASNNATTADLSRLAWEGVPGDWPFDATTGQRTVYEYAGAGNAQPFLVGVGGPNDGPGSTDLISACSTLLGVRGTMSADGRTVYFTAQGGPACFGTGANAATPVPANALYARVDGELPSAHTVPISVRSPADCTTPACTNSPPADASFFGASADGSKAYFTSTQQLTDDASQGANNLYLYDWSQPAGHELIDVSAGDTSGAGPRVRQVLAVSADGSHAYFVAKGVLTAANAEGKSPTAGANNLYVYDAATGAPAFIATLSGSHDQESWTFRPNVTPDGRFLVFTSAAQLTADDTSQSGAQQVFRYDAQSEALLRISIGERGFNDNGNRSTPTACLGGEFGCLEDARIAQTQGHLRRDPTMSDDGSYVFFESAVALAPGALEDVLIGTNGNGDPVYAQNVYQWHAGHVSLISAPDPTQTAGTSFGCPSSSSVCLLGTDAEGRNVFFSTTDALAPSDGDTELDFYDARIGGGFAVPPAPVPCPSSEACHLGGTEKAPAQTHGSAGFNGPEEGAKHPVHPKKAHHKHKKKHGKKAHKHHQRAGANRGGQR